MFYLFFSKKSFRGSEACFASCCVTCLTLQGAGQKWYTTLSVLDETVAKTRSTKPNENGEFLLQQTVSNFKGLIAGLGHLIDFVLVFVLKDAGATQQHSRMLEVPAAVAG
jgi:hypothetical protein